MLIFRAFLLLLLLVDALVLIIRPGALEQSLKSRREASNHIMTSIRVLVVDINLEGSLEVRVAQTPCFQLYLPPGGVQGVLDDLTPMDDGEVVALDVNPTDLKEGVTLPEEILFIQVSPLQSECDQIVVVGNFLCVHKHLSTTLECSGESSTLPRHHLA